MPIARATSTCEDHDGFRLAASKERPLLAIRRLNGAPLAPDLENENECLG